MYRIIYFDVSKFPIRYPIPPYTLPTMTVSGAIRIHRAHRVGRQAGRLGQPRDEGKGGAQGQQRNHGGVRQLRRARVRACRAPPSKKLDGLLLELLIAERGDGGGVVGGGGRDFRRTFLRDAMYALYSLERFWWKTP